MVPYAWTEQIFAVLVLMLIKFFNSFFYAEAENFNSSINSSYANHTSKLSSIANYMKMHKMPKVLINRVMKYEDLLWKTFKGNELQTILNDLPQTL